MTSADEGFQDVLGELAELAAMIDLGTYTGRAWPVRRRRVRRIVLTVAAVGSAAAAIILAVLVWDFLPRPDGQWTAARPAATQVASAPAQSEPDWFVLAQIDPSVSAEVSFEIPSLTMPSGTGEGGGLEWELPTISFPASEEGSESYDS